MARLRPLFASVLLAVALVGTVIAPAVHWAGHGMEGAHAHDGFGHVACAHGSHEPFAGHEHRAASEVPDEVPDGLALITNVEAAQEGECPGCAHFQRVLGSEPTLASVSLSVGGDEPPSLQPEEPATHSDIATPEERGPPMA
ncbi:MAG: hypothetical protein AAGI52_07705 [Bacteroidota bacterium]